jgi:hypothetical protein
MREYYSPFLAGFVKCIPGLVLSVFIDRVQVFGNVIVVPREHKAHRNNAGWHHHDPFRRDRIWMNKTHLICSHPWLFLLCITIQCTEIDITRGLVDPLISCSSFRLETFMYNHCREGEEKSIQTRRMLAKLSLFTFEKRFEHGFHVWQIRSLWSYWRHTSRVW